MSEAKESLAARIYDQVLYHYGSTFSWQGNVPGAWEVASARHREAGIAGVAALLEPAGEGLAQFDAAVSAELPRVSTVEYNSHEICKFFAENVRKRLAASPKTNGGMGS